MIYFFPHWIPIVTYHPFTPLAIAIIRLVVHLQSIPGGNITGKVVDLLDPHASFCDIRCLCFATFAATCTC